MEMTIEEGPLVEVPTPAATGMDRRALGEFVGIRGEIASYAIGWTTAADPTSAPTRRGPIRTSTSCGGWPTR